MSQRQDRVAELLRAELSDLLLFRIKDPRVHLASVAGIDVSGDLGHARVRISVLGDEAQRQGAVEALQHAAGFIRSQLGKRLRLRVTPELVFVLDRGAEHSQRMTEILENLHVGDEDS
jgi:ribosome-binding factor A